MSTPCAGAVSTPKAGVPAGLVIDQQYVQSLLPPALAFLYPYLPWMKGLQIGDVTAFCLADPPSFVLPSADDFLSFITSGYLGSYFNVNTFLQNLTRAYLWNNICQCTGGGTPTPPTPPANPGNLPVANPPTIVTLPPVLPCWDFKYLPSMTMGTGFGQWPVPAGLRNNYVQVTGAWTLSALATSVSTKYTFYDAGSAVLYQTTLTWTPADTGTTKTAGGVVTGAIALIRADWTQTGAAGLPASHGADEWAIYCDGNLPTTIQQPCCPPDPAVKNRMEQLLELVTLLQRQLAPFAYIKTTVHAGLTGTGSVPVAGLLGLEYLITTPPAGVVTLPGNPGYVKDQGWLSVSEVDGMIQEHRATRTQETWFPPYMQLADHINYFFTPGTVATITEIVREP